MGLYGDNPVGYALRQHLSLLQLLLEAGQPPSGASVFATDSFIFMSTLKLPEQTITCFPKRNEVQSSLSVGTVPEHWNEVNMAIKESYGCSGFPEHTEVMFNYTSLPRV